MLTRTKVLDLRSSDYKFVKPTAGADLIAGSYQIISAAKCEGFTLADVTSGNVYTLITEASQVRANKPAEAIAVGDQLYYNSTNDEVTKTAPGGGEPVIGVCIEAVVTGDDTVLFDFNGKGVF